MTWTDHDAACAVARRAAIELDEASRWEHRDPQRLAAARAGARAAFDDLVIATRKATAPIEA